MTTGTAAADVRRALGPVGASVGVMGSSTPVDDQRRGVRRLEAAGYPAIWTNETVGNDALVRAALWLAATEHVVIGTCIANMWARPAQTADAAATALAEAYPGRFVLGLGVGRPEQAASVGREFGSPVTTAREYLQAMPGRTYPRLLAANGPRMLALAAELADGAFPAGVPPTVTAQARTTLGEDGLLVVYLSVLGMDATAASDAARSHLDAGADHVALGLSYDTDFAVAVDTLEQLAPAVTRI